MNDSTLPDALLAVRVARINAPAERHTQDLAGTLRNLDHPKGTTYLLIYRLRGHQVSGQYDTQTIRTALRDVIGEVTQVALWVFSPGPSRDVRLDRFAAIPEPVQCDLVQVQHGPPTKGKKGRNKRWG